MLAGTTTERFGGDVAGLARLAAAVPLAIAGPGATPAIAEAAGARLLAGDPVSAAENTEARPP